MSNPFLDFPTQPQQDYAAGVDERRAQALAIIAASGIKEGDYVKVSWKVDDRHGGMTLSHEGILAELTDTWIDIQGSPRSPGHLKMGTAAIVSCSSVIGKSAPAIEDNPFMATTNPFL